MNYVFRVKFCLAAAILLMLAAPLPAQTNDNDTTFDVNDMLGAAQQWAQENLDTNVVAAVVQNVDRKKVSDFLEHFQDYLQGDYVLDLAQLKDTANAILPALDANEDTRPYAAWLRARMDYFDVAQEMKSATPPAVPPSTNHPSRLPNPSYATEQKFWTRKLAPRPLPAAAKNIVPQLKKIFVAEHVPSQLVWIAEVESDFDARARSPAGAVGLFQLMPATAKDFGLHLWPFDQRKQVDPSARAAARYLRQLHGQFDDWRLAVAAYNCGQGTVQHALRRYGAQSYAGIAEHLPAETQMYVPKVEATIFRREGVSLEQL